MERRDTSVSVVTR